MTPEGLYRMTTVWRRMFVAQFDVPIGLE